MTSTPTMNCLCFIFIPFVLRNLHYQTDFDFEVMHIAATRTFFPSFLLKIIYFYIGLPISSSEIWSMTGIYCELHTHFLNELFFLLTIKKLVIILFLLGGIGFQDA
jgi:hypothetical protein